MGTAVAVALIVFAAPRRALAESAPAVARLSYAVAPSRRAELVGAYEQGLAPLLAAHGMVALEPAPAAGPDSICSWRFAFASAAAYGQASQNLVADAVLVDASQDLETRFGDGRHRVALTLVAGPAEAGATVPAGPGRRVLAGAGSRQGPWHNLGVADGLPDPAVICVFQDRQGNLWLGTDGGGVSRFDGEEITTFTTADGLADNIVSTILEDAGGNLWFGTGTHLARTRGGGLSRYDGRTFTTFDERRGLEGNCVLALAEDGDGNLWISTYAGGVTCLRGPRLVGYDWSDGLPGNLVLAMARDRDGSLWLGTDGGLARWDGQGFRTLRRADGLACDTVLCVRPEPAGGLWVGTVGGVSHWDGQAFTSLTERDGLAQNFVTSAMVDGEGNAWFGTWERGISRWDGRHFTHFGPEDGLAHWRILSMLADRSGDLWFGGGGEDASGNGVSRYTGDELVTFTTAEGLSADEVMCLAEDQQGRLWAGTWAGADRYDGERFQAVPGIADNVRAILPDRQGRVWLATRTRGVYRYDGGHLTRFTRADGLASDWVETLAEDAAGNLWCGTFSGVSRFDGKRWTTFTARDGLGGDGVEAILADPDGTVWLGTNGQAGQQGALTRFDGSSWTTYRAPQGLPGSRVTALARDRQGYLWVGTEGRGVSRFDGRAFTTFTTADGLGNNKVVHVLADRDGQLWLATYGGGVSRYDGAVFQTLLQRDGLAHDGAQQVLQDGRGDFWIATEGGLTRYRPRRYAPSVSITGVTADGDRGPTAEVDLSTSPGRVAFEFLGGSFRTRAGQMLYRYRLAGRQDEWRTTRQRRVSYGDLAAGDYTFEVRAVDRDLNYSEPAAVRVHVRPDYERLGWLSALLPAVLLVGWQTARVIRRDHWLRETNAALSAANRQVEEANRRKSEFLARMSHDLRTPMNAIVGYTRILLRRARGVLDERQYRNLENIEVSADHLLSLINDILDLSKVEAGRVVLAPEPVDLERLIAECSESVASLLKPGVELVRRVEEVKPLRTDLDRLRRVLMNLLSNAVKFTDTGRITVSLRADGDEVELAVADTGIGIPEAELATVFDEFRQARLRRPGEPEGTGLGLAIARRSVEILGGSISVTSRVNEGSRFAVRLRDLRPQ
ncbi:MAG: two-component regulator propeller domain-containing protein [Gemmatimonadota bacterium]